MRSWKGLVETCSSVFISRKYHFSGVTDGHNVGTSCVTSGVGLLQNRLFLNICFVRLIIPCGIGLRIIPLHFLFGCPKMRVEK